MMFRIRGLTLAIATVLTLLTASSRAADEKPASPTPTAVGSGIQLTDKEQHELQTLLDARLAREREYREALLAAQAGQARFDAATSSLEAKFYKLCAQYKIDPDRNELSADCKTIEAKKQAAK